jgi:hypothetical protein
MPHTWYPSRHFNLKNSPFTPKVLLQVHAHLKLATTPDLATNKASRKANETIAVAATADLADKIPTQPPATHREIFLGTPRRGAPTARSTVMAQLIVSINTVPQIRR